MNSHKPETTNRFTMIAFILFAVLAILPLFIYLRNPYFMGDLNYAFALIRVGMQLSKIRKSFSSILDSFLDKVQKHPQKTFLIFEENSYTYSQADKESNKVARALWTHAQLKEGDTAALLLGNEPQLVWVWLALAKLGCVASILNSNIRSKSLLHCFSCCEAKALIVGADLQEAVEEVLPALREQGIRVFLLSDHSDVEGIESLSDKFEKASDQPLSPQLRANINLKSPALYIYTSGTTGLPKAAVVNHESVWLASFLQAIAGVRSSDVLYLYLPLYHTAGLLMGLCGAINIGITVVLKRKFSVSSFWNDCRKHNVTVIQYIGEIMRYLCSTPK
ncbi:hypothetical protein ILYODFUR_024360, partial [Ilyodon furcidens]